MKSVACSFRVNGLSAAPIKIVEPFQNIIVGINRIFAVAAGAAQDKRIAPVAREI